MCLQVCHTHGLTRSAYLLGRAQVDRHMCFYVAVECAAVVAFEHCPIRVAHSLQLSHCLRIERCEHVTEQKKYSSRTLHANSRVLYQLQF
jgi:hypothetical protein